MYEKVPTDLNFVQRENRVRAFWQQRRIFEKSLRLREGAPTFTFYDGPPTANGKPHIGHVLTRVIKDLVPRYQTMKGYQVPRKAGWDTHGLPVELEVERLLGLDGKEQIEQYGLEPFIEHCKESVWKYKNLWEDFSRTVGFWADMEHPYVTYDNNFIESEWWALKQIFDKGLLYKGFKVVPYCPRCGTPLSSHEVAQGYKDVKEKSAIVRFKAKDEDAYFLAWTTTPWTLPSNVALCVNPEECYVRVRCQGQVYYLAETLAPAVLGAEYEVLHCMLGKELEHRAYEPLFDLPRPKEGCWYITCDSYVTLTEGTGIVHLAPAFGEDDAAVGRKYGLPFVQLVDGKGKMTADTKWPGLFCKDADPCVLEDLEKRGLLYDAPELVHSYPHCWRCDTPLIYYARESWFIEMTRVKDQLIRNNNTVHWLPESIGKGRFGDWLENVQDWGVSRNRYWGTPLNIWECPCGHRQAVGSIQELRQLSPVCPAAIELHRPFLDAVTIPCPHCGKPMHRVPEVVDCWFDSGSMPFAQHHYPFENKEEFEGQFPADFISEAVDQTRGWFYSLLAVSTLLFDRAPYKNVLVLGHVQDENGQKMSKSKGNAVDPFKALEQFGADALRWYFCTGTPWLPSRFSAKAVVEGQRKFLSTLWNTYAFYVLYAEIDQFNPTGRPLEQAALNSMDRWLLSRLHTTVRLADDCLGAYRIPEAARALQDFTEELSNWYVRRSRERFWAPGLGEDKIAAYLTLHTALVALAKASAPLIPYMSESIYQNLVRGLDASAPESVHLCDCPQAEQRWIDQGLETDMELVRRIAALGRAARNAAGCKNRQPLARLYVQAPRALPQDLCTIAAEELNVKEILFVEDLGRFHTYSIKPQRKLLGKRFGSRLEVLGAALSELDGRRAMEELEATGSLQVELQGEAVTLTREELLVETVRQPGFETAAEGDMAVALDTRLTPALEEEGLLRELISKIQAMRKSAGFHVTDSIGLYMQGAPRLEEVFTKYKEEIAKDVLARRVHTGAMAGFTQAWEINGMPATLGVERAE